MPPRFTDVQIASYRTGIPRDQVTNVPPEVVQALAGDVAFARAEAVTFKRERDHAIARADGVQAAATETLRLKVAALERTNAQLSQEHHEMAHALRELVAEITDAARAAVQDELAALRATNAALIAAGYREDE